MPARFPASPAPGLVLSGFVDRVGDPVPLVAADGSAHRGEQVLAEALDAMARTVDGGRPIAIAVPAHWGPGDRRRAARRAARPSESGARRRACRADPRLGGRAGGAAGCTRPARPRASSCCATSAAAAPASRWPTRARTSTPSAQTVRHPEFSGDAIDQALLNHVLAGLADANDADPAGTAAVGRWPACATSAGRPRSGCPPRPRRSCPPNCPVCARTSG